MWTQNLFLKTWNPSEFLKELPAQAQDPLLRILLSLDGNTTRALEAVHLPPLELKVLDQSSTLLDAELARFLEIPLPAPKTFAQAAISRQVCLKKGSRKILFASTRLVARTQEGLLEDIIRGQKPIGTLMEEKGLPSLKDKITIGRLVHPEISQALGLAPATELWGRHYRLTIADQAKASVLEIFPPSS